MKQCPQCRRSYDDSQSFCLMDGTPLIDEPDEPTAVRQPSAPKKKRWLLWLGLAALLGGFLVVLLAGILIYEFVARTDKTRAIDGDHTKSSPGRTTSPTPKSDASNNNTATNDSSTPTEKSPSQDAESEDEITPIDWDTNGSGFKDEVGMTYKFRCPPGGTEHIVWGSDIYTADSSICTAAVHAGLFSLTDGGIVTVEFRPGRLTYGSTTRNGIKSNTFGEFGRSFVVR